ncbi:MAG: helix-turn-helix domain-containing protein [Bacteroidales bacterium]|nr:helix-turn-helix domain-containing protein [Bacteroidales bacterium]
MEVNILELAKNCPGVAITVRAEDLINANAMLIAETRRAMESEANTKKEVTLLTCEEVTQRLNVAPSTLWRWKKKGYLTPVEFGGQFRYRSTDIERLLEG